MFNPDPKPPKQEPKPRRFLRRTAIKRKTFEEVKKAAKDKPRKTPLKRNTVRFNGTSPQKRRKALKRVYKPTGELALFKQIYEERGRKCEITGEPLVFSVWHFAHILTKAAYPKFRLNSENIMLVHAHIHALYDTSTKEQLLKYYPKATIIFEKKQELKQQYYANRI